MEVLRGGRTPQALPTAGLIRGGGAQVDQVVADADSAISVSLPSGSTT